MAIRGGFSNALVTSRIYDSKLQWKRDDNYCFPLSQACIPKQGWAHVEGGILGEAGELWDLVVALSTGVYL